MWHLFWASRQLAERSDLAVQEVQPWLPFENYNKTNPKISERSKDRSRFPHRKLMEVQSPSVKRPYDITMSRRTRKHQFPVQGNEKPKSAMGDATPKDDKLKVQATTIGEVKQGGENDHKSLKQLIIGDDDKEAMKGNSDERGKGSRNSLGEHFTEEEKQHLQLVRMQQKENLQGLKFKKLVSRYAKVLGHLLKAKRDPHLGDAGKKPVFKLSA
ncbi:hypothetical protein ACSQ67_009986 [Phaseolus vulgaris]